MTGPKIASPDRKTIERGDVCRIVGIAYMQTVLYKYTEPRFRLDLCKSARGEYHSYCFCVEQSGSRCQMSAC